MTPDVTYTELSRYLEGFCLQKIIENSHKDNLLDRSIIDLDVRALEERHERLEALQEWIASPTEDNAVKVLREIADEIIFIQAIGAIVAGYKNLKRC